MVVTGSRVGKSFGVEQVLEKNNLFDKLAGNKLRFGIEKGALVQLVCTNCYTTTQTRVVYWFLMIVIQYCMTRHLNLLKAALDSSPKRTLSWNTDSALIS